MEPWGPWRRSLLLRLALSNWRLITAQTMSQALLAENERLQRINPKESIWQMKKAELVELGIAELSLTRVQATKMTVDELRDRLRVSRKQAKEEEDPLTKLPVGMGKMKSAELVVQCTHRCISVAPLPGEKGALKTRAQMMLEIRNDVARRTAANAEEEWHMPMTVDAGVAAPADPAGSSILTRRTRAREAGV